MDLSSLFALAEEPDIIAVASTCCHLQLNRRGSRYQCLCPNPYHHDKHVGSFSINAATKFWGCFACDLGQHRGNVSLVSTLNNISRLEAAADICVAFGIISEGERTDLLSRAKRHDIVVRAPSSAHLYSTANHIKPCKPANILDAVYRSFIQATPPMTSEQQAALMAERHLDPEDLNDFFFLPAKSQSFWADFKKRLAENGQTGTLNDILSGIPGFMRYAKSHRWSFVGRSGCLCLISRNVSGQIIGFQMRLNGKGAKYVTFSSGSVDEQFYDMCCSSGVLVDVIPPKDKPSKVISMTEGVFKAKALSKMNVWALSVAGVGNWRHLLPAIRSVKDAINIEKVTFLICFDADMKTNKAVAKNAAALANGIMEEFPDCKVYFADWELEAGKGIDDVVNAGNADKLVRYPAEEYLKRSFFKQD